MPVFNLELKFDDRGTLQAVNQIDRVTGAADGATRAINNLGDSASRNGRDLSRMGDTGSKAADAISAAMKKAAGQVLALVGAFTAVNKAMDFMNRGLEFNASLEQSQIGIASLITSMVKLQDAQGNLLEGQNKYNAAQEISRGLMEQIQVLGLQTTADSKSIIEGFQAILAPALQAGIALENIPKFAVQGAQALQTLGVPLNQMRTELDALLTGSVNLSQDILAPKLFADVKGNLKEYIQGLRDAGKLEEEIFRRLEPYNLALKDTENTWAAISSNLGEALDKLAGDTSLNYTKAMKQSLSEIQDLIIDTKTGKLSQDFQEIAHVLADIQDWIGNKIVSSVQTLIGYTKDINFFLGSDMGQGALSAFTTALKVASGALAGFAIARAAAFAKDKGTALINASKEATDRYKQSVIAAAQAQKQAAYAELDRYRTWMQSIQAQRLVMQSEQQRQAILIREIQLVNQVTAAEQRLIQVQNMGAARAGLSSALKSLVGYLGGPWNIAITGAIAGLTYLATKEDDTAEATDRHTAAQNTYTTVIQGAIDANGKLTRSLTEVEAAEARAAERQFLREKLEEIRGYAGELADLENDFNNLWNIEAEGGEISDSLQWQNDAIEAAKKYFNEYRNGQATLDETKVKLDQIRQSMALGAEDSGIAKWLDRFIGGANLKELEKQLKDTQTALAETTNKSKQFSVANDDTEKSIKSMADALEKVSTAEKANVNTLEGAIKWLEKRNAQTEEGKAKSEALAKATDAMALATLNAAIATAEFNAAAANTALLGDNITEAMIQTAAQANSIVITLNSARDAVLKGMQDPNWGKTGGAGRKKSTGGGSGAADAKKAEEAAKKWQELNDQLDQLEGKSTGAAASLKRTLDEIAKTGTEAKKSAAEIEELQQAFIKATDTKNIKELNKELLQLEGNTRAVEAIERQEKTDQFKARVSEIKSLSEDEKNILLGRYEQAAQREVKVNDLQAQVDFMKELESLGGSYGLTVEKQNELLEYQAAIYREKLPAAMSPYIDEWERLKKLENDKSFMGGLERGVKKFGEQYGDLAANVESFTTQMGSTISSTISNAFMTGKFSAQDFFSSLVSMAAQAATNQFIGMIFQGLFGAFGSAAGSYNGLNSSAAAGAANTSGYSVNMGTRWSGASAKGNVFSGGNLGDYSGKIVNQPTFFAYGTHFTAYAKGAGLMGEKGPEAILPLARMSNGDLGVQYKLDSGRNTPQSDTANFGRIIAELQSQMREDRQYMGNNMPVINLNIENNANADVQAGQMKPDGNGGFSMDIIISQIEQGMVGRAKQGKSQLQQYQQAAYGFNRAGVIARGKGRN